MWWSLWGPRAALTKSFLFFRVAQGGEFRKINNSCVKCRFTVTDVDPPEFKFEFLRLSSTVASFFRLCALSVFTGSSQYFFNTHGTRRRII